jgi:peptide chain release factor 2
MDNAIVVIKPGAGGRESRDWAGMLVRMYTRWAERHDYKTEILNSIEDNMTDLENITLLVEGRNAYGYLKNECGVHRLVRISPFDANKRRHTSFALVTVTPDNGERKVHPVRSYVFEPYTLVKDLRTEHETTDVERVMDGDIDDFIQASDKEVI